MLIEGLVKGTPVALKGGSRIDIAWRAIAFCNDPQRYVFCVKLTVLVMKVVHAGGFPG